MEDFLIFNTLGDGKYPDAYKENYHCHILCRSGEMRFEAMGRPFTTVSGDLDVLLDVLGVEGAGDYAEAFLDVPADDDLRHFVSPPATLYLVTRHTGKYSRNPLLQGGNYGK